MQAIVQMGSAQYLVSPAQKLRVLHPAITGVLAILDTDKTLVGRPFVAGAVVKIKILGEFKGPKIRTATYKAKSRERKVRGFRSQLTEIQVENIAVKPKS